MASITPSPKINFIFGENGSGKSSFLEAIFILGRAKSFRSASIKSVVNTKHPHLIVSAQTGHSDGGGGRQLGVQLNSKHIEIRINQESGRHRSELAYALPLQIIHPKSYELLDGGAQIRREFLDWGIFNDDKGFLPAWQKFKKALAQRNVLLKNQQVAQLNVWDKELAYYGTIVNQYRFGYVEKFKPFFIEISQQFLTKNTLDLTLLSGWEVSKTLQEALSGDRVKDLRYGFTHSGPHRGDFLLRFNHCVAKDFISRGQLKLLVLSLKLAQIQLLTHEQGALGCILIDDFAAELDANHRSKLLKFLSTLGCQVFITATTLTDFGDVSQIPAYKMFHVEHGTIKQI
jgi:DNA replication and repair protein RecF